MNREGESIPSRFENYFKGFALGKLQTTVALEDYHHAGRGVQAIMHCERHVSQASSEAYVLIGWSGKGVQHVGNSGVDSVQVRAECVSV